MCLWQHVISINKPADVSLSGVFKLCGEMTLLLTQSHLISMACLQQHV